MGTALGWLLAPGVQRRGGPVGRAYTSSKQQPITTSQYYFQRYTLKNKLSN